LIAALNLSTASLILSKNRSATIACKADFPIESANIIENANYTYVLCFQQEDIALSEG